MAPILADSPVGSEYTSVYISVNPPAREFFAIRHEKKMGGPVCSVGHLEKFNDYRNTVMHSRSMTELVRMSGETAMIWFDTVLPGNGQPEDETEEVIDGAESGPPIDCGRRNVGDKGQASFGPSQMPFMPVLFLA